MLDCDIESYPSQISKNKILIVGYDKIKHHGCNHDTQHGNSKHREYGLSLMNLDETEVLEKAKQYSSEHPDIAGFTYNKGWHRIAIDNQDSKKLFIFFHIEINGGKVCNANNCILYIKHD